MLFLATNAAVLRVLSTVLQRFGVERWLFQEGAGINLNSLFVFAALVSAFVSPGESKWM